MPLPDTIAASPRALLLASQFTAVLAPNGDAVLQPIGGLPTPCLLCPAASTLICATPISASMFRTQAFLLAAERRLSVIVLRMGTDPLAPEDSTVDAAVAHNGTVELGWDMLPFVTPDRRLFLVPSWDQRRPSVRVHTDGLATVAAPYLDIDERSDGLCRAAADTLRLLRRRRAAR